MLIEVLEQITSLLSLKSISSQGAVPWSGLRGLVRATDMAIKWKNAHAKYPNDCVDQARGR